MPAPEDWPRERPKAPGRGGSQRPGKGERRPDSDPSALTWLVALIGMALPWVGAGLGIAGAWCLRQGKVSGWWMLAAAAAALIGDVLIDLLFAHSVLAASDHPDLNRRAAQLIGRQLIVTEAIEGGRGKVRAGDTLWPAEGPDTPLGGKVSVTGTNGTALVVERAEA